MSMPNERDFPFDAADARIVIESQAARIVELERELAEARAIVAELVALDDLKKRMAPFNVKKYLTDEELLRLGRLQTELAKREPPAWDAARALPVKP